MLKAALTQTYKKRRVFYCFLLSTKQFIF